jgi:hypothetical protein
LAHSWEEVSGVLAGREKLGNERGGWDKVIRQFLFGTFRNRCTGILELF